MGQRLVATHDQSVPLSFHCFEDSLLSMSCTPDPVIITFYCHFSVFKRVICRLFSRVKDSSWTILLRFQK